MRLLTAHPCVGSTSPSAGWAAPSLTLHALSPCPLLASHSLPVGPQHSPQPNSSLSSIRVQTFSSCGSEASLAPRCLFPGRRGPGCCQLWAMSSYQPLAPQVLQAGCPAKGGALALAPKSASFQCRPHHSSNSLHGRRRRTASEKEEYFHPYTSFAAEYPNWLLWICYLFAAVKAKSDSAPRSFTSHPDCGFGGYLG